MNNNRHEIICPDNKGIQNYLWRDYFHDSKINNINYDNKQRLVTLSLECQCEISKIWYKLSFDNDAHDAYMKEHMDSFTYNLVFKEVQYFHTERLIMSNDYLTGSFKDTALLRKLTTECKKPLYHFRIQIDDGYIDIIFAKFIIRKKTGRIKYPVKGMTRLTCETAIDDEKKAALDGDDFERFLAIKKLQKENSSNLLEIARNNLWLDGYGESCFYSAYLLGKFGDISDIPKLFELYMNVEDYLLSKPVCRCASIIIKRNVLDAIELIYHRCKAD